MAHSVDVSRMRCVNKMQTLAQSCTAVADMQKYLTTRKQSEPAHLRQGHVVR